MNPSKDNDEIIKALKKEVKKEVKKKAEKYSKVTKYIIFLIFFLVILEIVNQIFFFFDLGGSMGYTYIIWFTIIFILFITLPINRSKLSNPENEISSNQPIKNE